MAAENDGKLQKIDYGNDKEGFKTLWGSTLFKRDIKGEHMEKYYKINMVQSWNSKNKKSIILN